MASTSPPTRVDKELYESARSVAATMSRSTAQQLSHWARIGRELEASDSVSAREISAVLAGHTSYDSLNSHEQAVVRGEWAERIDARLGRLDLRSEFEAAERSWAELDESGSVVVRGESDTPDS